MARALNYARDVFPSKQHFWPALSTRWAPRADCHGKKVFQRGCRRDDFLFSKYIKKEARPTCYGEESREVSFSIIPQVLDRLQSSRRIPDDAALIITFLGLSLREERKKRVFAAAAEN